jgi:hypothetical protein
MDGELNARVLTVEQRLERHDVMLETLARDFQMLRNGMATRELVDAAIGALAGQVAATEEALSTAIATESKNIDLKLQHLREQVEPIRKGIARLVWVVILAIVGAVLAMVLNGPPPIP